MNENTQDMLFDLLIKKAVYGLDETEQRHLDELDSGNAEMDFGSLELATAAVSMVGLSADEPLPAHLRSRILADADRYFTAGEAAEASPWPKPTGRVAVAENKSSGSWFGWFGWAAAAAASIALAVNIGLTRFQPKVEVAQNQPPVEVPRALTPADMRNDFIRATPGIVKAAWAPGNVKELKQLSGDVVWSDAKQAGYMRLSGLPINDGAKETYQLWIFDKTQDKATPIDGGTFDVTSDGDVVIPINAKLKAKGPEMFAISIEKPGGVVVSKRDKLAAIAKVESQPISNS